LDKGVVLTSGGGIGGNVRVAEFAAELASVRRARMFVSSVLNEWGVDELIGDAALCTSELAANAVLHSRNPFTFSVRTITGGVRVDALDSRPDLLPFPTPTDGTASDLTALGATGRGLLVLASVASRWGASTSAGMKAVWAEITRPEPTGSRAPVLDLTPLTDPRTAGTELRFLSLPVRASVASGIQLEELMREAQLNEQFLDAGKMAELFDLSDRSAIVRLTGRHAALQAAAVNAERFDLDLTATVDALTATAALGTFLTAFSGRSTNRVAQVSLPVAELPTWLTAEAAHQGGGGSPRICPLDS
jgi:anti-sigma regulatory factor (Ser/Thr protein kinase)